MKDFNICTKECFVRRLEGEVGFFVVIDNEPGNCRYCFYEALY